MNPELPWNGEDSCSCQHREEFCLKQNINQVVCRRKGNKTKGIATPQIRHPTECPHTGLIHPGFIHRRHASQPMGLVATSLIIHKQWRTFLRRATNHRQRRWSMCHNGYVFQTVMSRCMWFEHVLFWIVITRAIIVNKVITNCATGTPILHEEAWFISVERGLSQGILSRTSLKYHIHFSFILKLIIFIYKQLKRPVAFSAVHWFAYNWPHAEHPHEGLIRAEDTLFSAWDCLLLAQFFTSSEEGLWG